MRQDGVHYLEFVHYLATKFLQTSRARAQARAANGIKKWANVKGRTVRSATIEPERLIVVFDDHSTMTVKTAAGLAAAISVGAKVKAVVEDADECTMQFEDGSSVTMMLANPGASVAVRARNSAVEYLG